MDSRNRRGSGLLMTSIMLGQILLGSCSAAVNETQPQTASGSAPAAANIEAKGLEKNLAQQSRLQSDAESCQGRCRAAQGATD
jgi:hypothetical protein